MRSLRRAIVASVTLAACGGTQADRLIDGVDPIANDFLSEETLPAVDRLDDWLEAEATTHSDALMRSFALEAAGRHDDGLRAVAAVRADDAWLDIALALRTSQFRHAAPGFDQLAWSDEPTGAHDVARGLRHILNALIEYRTYRYSMQPGIHVAPQSGLPATWRTVGPLETLATVNFGRPTPVSGTARLPAAVELETGAVRTLLAPVSSAGVRIPMTTSGRYAAETFVRTVGVGGGLVRISGSTELSVEVDGRPIFVRGPDDIYDPQARWVWLDFEPGLHQIRVVSSVEGSAVLALNLIPSADLLIECFGAECEGPLGTSSARFAGALEDLLVDDSNSNLEWLVAVDVAVQSGSSELAYSLLDSLQANLGGGSGHPVLLYHAARLSDVLFQMSPTQRDELRRAYLTETATQWDAAASAVRGVARILMAQEQLDRASDMLTELVELHPDDFHVQAELAELYEMRGWQSLRRQALERAAVEFPRHCPTISAVLDDRSFRGEPIDREALPPTFLQCDGALRAIVEETLLPSGRLDEAVELTELLRSRNPNSRRYAWLAADTLAAAGRSDEARSVWSEFSRWSYDAGPAQMWSADLLLSEGGRAAASDALDRLGEEYPAQVDDQFNRQLIDGVEALSGMRRNGADAVAAYLEEAPEYEAGMVYVLDYGVTRLFEDGSGIDLVHQIIEIRNRDALGALGETGIPQGAHLLTAAVHKRDGTILIPDDIAGKDSISMPNLEIGDFIELEWADSVYGPWAERPAYRSSRFFFQSFDGVFHESMVQYIVPESFENRVVLDERNLTDSAHIERIDGTVAYTIAVQRSEPPTPDGSSVNSAEWIPSVRMAHAYSWSDAVARYTDALAGVAVPSESLRAGVLELISDVESDRDEVRAIYRLVSDEIIDFGSFMSTPAAWTWESGEGEALPLLIAMLESVGYEPEVLFVRPWDQDAIDSSIPDALVYDLTAVRVPLSDGEVWLEPDFERYPFDYLRIDAQDCDALVVSGDRAGQFVRTPRWDEEIETNRILMNVELDESGDASVQIVETLPVRIAQGFRLYVQSADDLRDIERQLEGALSSTFPGIRQVEMSLLGLDATDGPLEIHYEFISEGFASDADSSLVFDGEIFSRAVANWYADRSSREQTLLVSMPVYEELRVSIRGPDGWSFAEYPVNEEQTWKGSRWSRSFSEDQGQLTFVRSLVLPIQRVASDEYDGFASFLRDFQAGDRIRVELTP